MNIKWKKHLILLVFFINLYILKDNICEFLFLTNEGFVKGIAFFQKMSIMGTVVFIQKPEIER